MMQVSQINDFIDVENLCSENYSLQAEQEHIQHAIKSGLEIVKDDDFTLTFDLDSDKK